MVRSESAASAVCGRAEGGGARLVLRRLVRCLTSGCHAPCLVLVPPAPQAHGPRQPQRGAAQATAWPATPSPWLLPPVRRADPAGQTRLG